MLDTQRKFYISTAIPYVNADPHIGFALELIQADVIARYRRLLKEEVFFVTGTDENALKNVVAAGKRGVSPKEFVDAIAEKYKELISLLTISNDDFIRTTEDRHIRGAQKLWQSCKKEDIYKKSYEGLYCAGCEEFYKETELEAGVCPEHKTRPERVAEENYFFRLSNYQHDIERLIKSNTLRIIPETRKNEMLRFIERGLEDFSISRSNERARNWGVPVPGDDSQRMYVWVDALSNYINALGYADNDARFKIFWQENGAILHCIGKGITRFHAIYWPAILLSAGIRLPKTIFVHGYLTVEGQKMSKSIGNVVSPQDIVVKYGTDALRYYLLREISPTEDGDFSQRSFGEHYNGDLANGLGNLVSRVAALALKSADISLAPPTPSPEFKERIDRLWDGYRKALDNFKFNEALNSIWGLIGFCNEYIAREKPWEEKESSIGVVADMLHALGNIAWLLIPFLPTTSEKIFSQLGINAGDTASWGGKTMKIKKGESLFPRI